MISNLFIWLCVRWFRITGWVIPKSVPKHLRNYVLCVAPHTSNIDFFVGVASRKLLNINVKYLAKKELFTFPFKKLFLNLGGFPVDRSKNTSLVDFVVEKFNEDPDFAICVTPEGTRKKVEKLKTGFYHMASKAGVPIILCGFDFEKKWVIVSEPFLPSINMESDIAKMNEFFEKIIPKHPELSSYSQ